MQPKSCKCIFKALTMEACEKIGFFLIYKNEKNDEMIRNAPVSEKPGKNWVIDRKQRSSFFFFFFSMYEAFYLSMAVRDADDKEDFFYRIKFQEYLKELIKVV